MTKDSESTPIIHGSVQQQTAGEEKEDLVSLDHILEHLGGAGTYQISVLLLMTFCKIFPGMVTLSALFTTATMDYTCSPSWINDTFKPANSSCFVSVSSDQCQVTLNCSSPHKTFTENCVTFHWNRSVFQSTIVSHFSLVCSKSYLVYLSNIIFFLGFMIGCTVYGAVSDRFGRKKTITITGLHLLITTTLTPFSPFYWIYLLGQFLMGFGIGGLLSVLYTFALENTTIKYRTLWGFIVHNGWTVGMLLVSLLAYFVRDFQLLLLYIGLSFLLLFPVCIFICESPRWLYSMKKFNSLDRTLIRIANLNNQCLPANFLSENCLIISGQMERRYNVLDLLRTAGLRKISCVVWYLFFCVSMGYFGISLCLGDLGGDVFMNQVYSALVEPVARLTGFILSSCISRKGWLLISYSLSGCFLLATGLLLEFDPLVTLRIALAMTGKFWITLSFDLSWLYTAELFPTVIRTLGIGSASTMARVGALGSQAIQLLENVWKPLPFILYAIGPLLSFSVLWLSPETKGKKLPESVEEAEVFARYGSIQ